MTGEDPDRLDEEEEEEEEEADDTWNEEEARRSKPPEWWRVRNVVDSYYDLQRIRIAVGHRLDRIRKGMIAADEHVEELQKLYDDARAHEKQMKRILGAAALSDPTGRWLRSIRGVGPVLSAGLLAYFDPIPRWSPCRQLSKSKRHLPRERGGDYDPPAGFERTNPNGPPFCEHSVWVDPKHPSSYWKFAGYAPGADRLERGKKAPYARGAKVLCWKVATSLIRLGNPEYRAIYDSMKEVYSARRDLLFDANGKPKAGAKGHIDMMAKRAMVKEFLLRFWTEHRKNHGLPISTPYDPHDPRHHPEGGKAS